MAVDVSNIPPNTTFSLIMRTTLSGEVFNKFPKQYSSIAKIFQSRQESHNQKELYDNLGMKTYGNYNVESWNKKNIR